ncbi:Gfo/Idh/MocA family protein [Legionella worsleiensis]|uniref:Putative dehydrogenase n=1 Tax=Legionella worsleiensis TaxID=45076 RepID=A0A0W1A3B3_9GAMM|nr:Gfo/Idh/MocA family oxidoreductase [Legionella worsleiensis]KTD75868.1 putative dehydrogenase [Legionella worsleiensis]STY32881.1 putative dehydrogenase [Legionella worsleiensis]
MNELNIAVIGAGKMGREHIKAFQAIEGVNVTGLLSRTLEKAHALAKEFNIPCVAQSVDELHQKSQADLVVVAVPELEANQVAKHCFQYQWAVLLEKPAGYDLKDAYDIAEAALTTNKPVYVGLNRRFYASAMTILDDLNSRQDDCRYIHIQDQQSYTEARACNHPEEVVQKFMYANSIHTIDLIRYFARGGVTKVVPILPWKKEETQIFMSYVEFDSGDKALYECIWKGPGPWACAVSTPHKRWTMQPLEQARYQNINERVVHDAALDDADRQYKAGFYKQAVEVCNGIRGLPSKAITINDSLKTMELIHQMYGV